MRIDFSVENITSADLNNIFDIMVEDFPQNELMDINQFEFLLSQGDYKGLKFFWDSKFIGYIFFYKTMDNKFLWLDYLAVMPDFRNMGFGSRILSYLKDIYDIDGIFVELDIPVESDYFGKKRIVFYERNNAVKINIDYNFPVRKDEFLKMYIYFIPFKENIPEIDIIENVISECFSVIHSDI